MCILTYRFEVGVQLRAVVRPVFNALFLLLVVLVNILASHFSTLRWWLRYLSGEQNVLEDHVVLGILLFALLLKQEQETLVLGWGGGGVA